MPILPELQQQGLSSSTRLKRASTSRHAPQETKCIYLEVECKFGTGCTRTFKHSKGKGAARSGMKDTTLQMMQTMALAMMAGI